MGSIESVRRYFKAWNDRDEGAIVECLIDGGTYEDPATGGPISGSQLRGYVEALWAAFPDLTFEERSIGETGPGRVAAEWTMRGTNTGSYMGLPPTGRQVELKGSDFFSLRDDRIATVTGYFDKGVVPRQLGLDIIVQPSRIGPFRFGTSSMVQTGKTEEPVAFSITCLEARNDEAVQVIREGARASLIEMLGMDGFIGATTATIGHRMVTISAWDSADAPRQVMRQGAHAEVQKKMYDGSLAKHGFTSVWIKERVNPYMVRCDACGTMTRGPDADRLCRCGARLPDPVPYW